MQSLLTTFLLFLAAIVALLTYLIVPSMSIMTLVTAASVALAVGVWWHWTQFSVDYRTATWPEQLRSYASYVMVLLVILLSYGVYVFVWSGSSLQDLAARTGAAVRNAGVAVANTTSRASNTMFSSEEGGMSQLLNLGGLTNMNRNRNRNRNLAGANAGFASESEGGMKTSSLNFGV